MAIATAHNVPTDEERASASRRARERNEKTLRLVVVDNGYIVTEMGTGETRVYDDAGITPLAETDTPQNVLEHFRRFLGRF